MTTSNLMLHRQWEHHAFQGRLDFSRANFHAVVMGKGLRSLKQLTTIRIIFVKNNFTCTISNMSSMSHRQSSPVGERTLHIYHCGRSPNFSTTQDKFSVTHDKCQGLICLQLRYNKVNMLNLFTYLDKTPYLSGVQLDVN